jgi:transcriptional regulator with XRE-family HTH domain
MATLVPYPAVRQHRCNTAPALGFSRTRPVASELSWPYNAADPFPTVRIFLREICVTIPRHHDARALLGHRVREIRRRLGKTLKEIGEAAGLSKSTLSKIENGSLSVSYDNLLKLARGLSTELPELFADGASPNATHANGRRSITRRNGAEVYETPQYRYELMCTDLHPRKMFPLVATLRARSTSRSDLLIQHSGEEFVFVLEGTAEVRTAFYSPVLLKPGDGIYFDSTMGHSLLSAGETDAKILWVGTSDVPRATAPTSAGAEQKRKTRRRRP